MLSAFERRQANEDNTLWRQNAAIIRQLYQDERKTLKEVKAIMENENGFPATPLPTWEVKLRELGIQKKLKAKDWSLIYKHIYPRLRHQGKKEFQKPTVILIHGTKKPWDKCWKEIRRNRVVIQSHHQGPLPALPSFISIRTPSPELLETISQRQPLRDVNFLVQQLFQTTVVSLQPVFELGGLSLNENSQTSTCPNPDSVYKLCLQGIPFTILLERPSVSLLSPHAVDRTGESQACDDRIISPNSQPSASAICGNSNSLVFQPSSIYARRLSEFISASSAGQQLGPNFDSHHYLSMIIYLLSNSHFSTFFASPDGFLQPDQVTVAEILQMTLKFVSIQLLSTLFQSQLLSIKAAWECLLVGAQVLKNKEAFEFFINIGIQNEWLELNDKGHEYLYSAAQMNCPELLHALIYRGCHIASYPSWCHHRCESIILETINNANLECAKLLVQNGDVNHEFSIGFSWYKSTHFAMFIIAFDDSRLDHLNCLKFLLEQGANVDYEIQPGFLHTHLRTEPPWWKAGQRELEEDWPLSILDYVYYCHRAVFPELLPYRKITVNFSRAMALWNLEQGVDALRQYCNSTSLWSRGVNDSTSGESIMEREHHCLEILLAEQFFLSIFLHKKTVLWSRVAALSELDINLMWLPQKEEPPSIVLYATACLGTSEHGQNKQQGLQIMQWLLHRGLQVNAKALLTAYSHGGVTIMQYLASFCDNIKMEGGKALVKAALKNDHNSAKLLLHLGVDPDFGTISTTFWNINVFEAAACGSTPATLKDLVQRGVKPRIGRCYCRPSLALVQMFLSEHVDELFSKVQYIVNEHMMIYEPLWPSMPLLEICLCHSGYHEDLGLRRKIFEFLLKKGAKLNVGSPLAEWIGTGGGHQLAQQMLGAGADPNAYSFSQPDPDHPTYKVLSRTPLQAAAGIGDLTLVCRLLEHGADVNAPANSQLWRSQTALNAICAWDPLRREERLRKGKIVQLILGKGAYVNAADSGGETAIMQAARLGDISTAFTLLKYGATPNAIATGRRSEEQSTALDIAACSGRLDMVKFLLNANALSSTAWSKGEDYAGSIERAKEMGYLVVCELIKRHSADRHRWNLRPGMPVATSLETEYTHQSLSLRTRPATALRLQSRSQHTTTENQSSTAVLDHTDDQSNTREEEFESGLAASKPEAKDTSVADITGASGPSSVEDIGDRASLAEAGCGEYTGARTYGAVDQEFHTEEATTGNEAWFYDTRGESWVKEDWRSSALLAPSSLAEDVFMGFPGFQNS